MWGMRYFLLIIAMVMGQSVFAADKKLLIADPIIEKAIRLEIFKPDEQELNKTDLEKMSRLNLSYTKISDAGLKELAKLPKLINLYLAETQISDAGLKEMAKSDAGLKDVAKLERLDLYSTKITDAGLKEVAKLKQLKELNLLGTKVTEAGVAELQKALPKCKISSNPKKLISTSQKNRGGIYIVSRWGVVVPRGVLPEVNLGSS